MLCNIRTNHAEYGAAEFFIQQARAAYSLRRSLFGSSWPFTGILRLGPDTSTVQDPFLLEYLEEARATMEGKFPFCLRETLLTREPSIQRAGCEILWRAGQNGFETS